MRAAITNITAGMLSDKMLGRADLARYVNGCLLLENMHVDPTGEWGKREAFVFCGKRKYADRAAIPVRFSYSETQSYCLEVGHLYMRVWKDGGLVLVGAGPAIFNLAMPYSEADLDGLWWTESADVLYFLHRLYEPRQLIRHDHDNWEIKLFELQDGPYLKENTDAVKHFVASANTGAITITATGAGHAPFTAEWVRRLIRWNQGNGTWSWLRIDAFTDATHVNATVMGANLIPLDVSSWRLGVYYGNHWPTTGELDQGRLMLGGADFGLDRTDGSANSDYPNYAPGVNDGDAFAWTLANKQVSRINAYASTGELILLTSGSMWRLSGSTDRDAITPKSVSAKKLSGYGSTKSPPAEVSDSVIWIDRSRRKLLSLRFNPDGLQGYAVHDLTVLCDHISGRDPELFGFVQIGWQESPKPTIWALRKDGIMVALTYVPEEKVNAFGLHPTYAGDGIERFVVIPNSNGNDDLYVFAKRMIAGAVVRTVERLQWDNLLRSPPEEKRLDCCISYDAPLPTPLRLVALDGANVIATTDDAAFDAAKHVGQEIRSIVVDYTDDDGKPVWRWLAARILSVDTTKQVHLKILAPFKELVVAAGTWRITTQEVSGADLYEGDTVSAQLDGQPVHGLAVAGGKVALPQKASIVHIGRRYSGRGLTMPIDIGQPPGVGQGRKSRINRVMVRLRDSIGGRLGAWKKGSATKWAKVSQPKWNWAIGRPPLPESADYDVFTAGTWTNRPQVIFEQAEPLPFNLQLVNPNIYAPWLET